MIDIFWGFAQTNEVYSHNLARSFRIVLRQVEMVYVTVFVSNVTRLALILRKSENLRHCTVCSDNDDKLGVVKGGI